MGALGLVLTLAGTAVSAKGAYEEGQAAKRASAYNARAAAAEAANQTERLSEIGQRIRAANVTRTAKSGVTLSGSPLEVLAYNARQVQRESDSILRASDAYQKLQHMMGQSAVEAARWNIAGSVLRGAGSAISGASGSGYNFAGGTSGGAGSGSVYKPDFNWNPYTPMRRAGS